MNGIDPSGYFTLIELLIASTIAAVVAGVVTYAITGSVRKALLAAFIAFIAVYTVGIVAMAAALEAGAAISAEAYAISGLLRQLGLLVLKGQTTRALAYVLALIQTPQGRELVRQAHVVCGRIMEVYGPTIPAAVFRTLQMVYEITKF